MGLAPAQKFKVAEGREERWKPVKSSRTQSDRSRETSVVSKRGEEQRRHRLLIYISNVATSTLVLGRRLVVPSKLPSHGPIEEAAL